MWLVVAIGVVGGLFAMIAGKGVAHVVAGHRYRFSWSVTPGLAGADLSALLATLTSSGALDATVDGTSDRSKTSGSYTMVASSTKDLTLGEPQTVLLGHALVFTNVTEVS